MYEDLATSKVLYEKFMEAASRANNCVQCGVCEEKCPQKIEIGEWLRKVHDSLV